MPQQYSQLGFGLGLRAAHYDAILESRPKTIDWFEIISENFMDAHGGYWEFLKQLRQDYTIVIHGVSMNIGSPDSLNIPYLNKLKKLAQHIDTPWISDHLCWTGVDAHNTHDLLPLPYTHDMLSHIATRIRQVQDIVQRPFVIENPSSYLEFNDSTMSEFEFMAALAEKADCGVLLDVNNIYVSAFNHGFDAVLYIDSIPADRIAQIHLAGHKHYGTHIIDTHDNPVTDKVWELYQYTIKTKGLKTTMIEWDEHIPAFDVMVNELNKARQAANILEKAA